MVAMDTLQIKYGKSGVFLLAKWAGEWYNNPDFAVILFATAWRRLCFAFLR
jgi:hypothetical protein